MMDELIIAALLVLGRMSRKIEPSAITPTYIPAAITVMPYRYEPAPTPYIYIPPNGGSPIITPYKGMTEEEFGKIVPFNRLLVK